MFNYKCERSQSPIHQCNGLRATYEISGTISGKSIPDAYKKLLPNLSMFMNALPGVFKLQMMTKNTVTTWEFDTRPAQPVGKPKMKVVR